MTVHPPTRLRHTVTRRRVLTLLPVAAAGVLAPAGWGRGPATRHEEIAARTGPQSAPGPFAMVGVSWPAPFAPVSHLEVRTSYDGTTWTGWTELHFDPEVAPDGPQLLGRSSTSPLWTGNARYVDLRTSGRLPAGARIHLVDPGRDPLLAGAAYAAPARPGIITREGWGANESIRKGSPELSEPLRLAVIHHTATSDSYGPDDVAAIVRGIYAYHVDANGWDDIGYNFLIDRFGRIYEGRAGGITRTVTGAHSQGFNRHTTGIAFIGNFVGAKPPEPAMQALKLLLAWRLDLGLVDPRGSTTYVSRGSNKYPSGHSVTLRTVSAHRDVGNTACPGGPVYGALEWMRQASYETGLPKMFDARLTRGVITPNDDGVSEGLSVHARFSGAVRWTAEVVDHAGSVRWSTTGSGSALKASWRGKDSQGSIVPHDTYRFRIRGEGVRSHELPFQVWRWPNGTFFVTTDGHSYILHNGSLRPPTSAEALKTWYSWGEAVSAPREILKRYPVGGPIGFRGGSIVNVSGSLYLISDGKRRPVSPSTLRRLGFNPAAIISTTEEAIAAHSLGPAVKASDGHPIGSAIKATLGQEAFVHAGGAHWFASPSARRSHRIRDVDLAGPADGAILLRATASRIGFRNGTLARALWGDTFVISGGRRLPISTRSFKTMGYKESNVRPMGALELLAHAEGPQL